jgi:hypothetical protein
MQSVLHITTKVLPGNKIEIAVPAGLIGEDVEVIIILRDKPQPPNRRVLETLVVAHKLRSFRTTEEIDRDL